MNSFYYGLSLFAILLILHWYLTNDGKGQDDGSLGFLATKKPIASAQPDETKATAKRSFRRKS